MRTQGILYPGKGTVYDCELEECPKCQGAMRVAYTSKFKLVQGMQGVMSIAQRARRCVNQECEAMLEICGSAKWWQKAPVCCTYGYDVIGQIGWWRQQMKMSFES